jgi:hypothetical protein
MSGAGEDDRARRQTRQYQPPQRHTRAGVELPRHTDGRTLSARRFKKLVDDFTAELGGSLSAADAALVRQAAALTLPAEQSQADIVNGVQVDPDVVICVSGEARRIFGLLRRKGEKAKPADQTLQEYLAQNYGSASDEASA